MATLQILDLSNVEYDLTGIGVGDPMAHPDQAAPIPQLPLQQHRVPQQQQLQPQQQPHQPLNQQQVAVDLDDCLRDVNLIEEILAAYGVDDPSALP